MNTETWAYLPKAYCYRDCMQPKAAVPQPNVHVLTGSSVHAHAHAHAHVHAHVHVHVHAMCMHVHVPYCLQPEVAVQQLLPISRHPMQLEQLLALRARAAAAAPRGATHGAGADAGASTGAACGGGGGGARVARRDEEREAEVRLRPEGGWRRRRAWGGRVPEQAA